MDKERAELARLIVSTLNLDFDLETVSYDTPLYGEGFGLDSIDILEVALAIAQKYKVTLHADDENNQEIFKSIGMLSDYIQKHKA